MVGLQTVHGTWLDDLAVPRNDGRKPTAPAVFLSGNGPLVEVLQYELRAAGDGKTFVRGVKDYVKRYTRGKAVPPEHVLVFDEAQRAWDAAYVDHKHKEGDATGKSEPEHFVEFAERIPEWGVVLALIGSGQEIHVGEEGGVAQWRVAIERSARSGEWQIHGPSQLAAMLATESVPFIEHSDLHLDTELRFHMAKEVHRFVDNLVHGADPSINRTVSGTFAEQYAIRITRDLEVAKEYLQERFSAEPEARYGILASSRDKSLVAFGIDNDFQSTKKVKLGRWYGEDEEDEGGWSCRHLHRPITEFQCQGLETDGALVAWGTDFVWQQVDA
ncbi:MAG: DNA/RNA helicase domain-containing protein, partial [Armatimonadaceae bacterium]